MSNPNVPQLIQKANRLNIQADEKFREGYQLLEESRATLDLLAAVFGMEKITGPQPVQHRDAEPAELRQ